MLDKKLHIKSFIVLAFIGFFTISALSVSAQYCTGANLGGGGCAAGQLINSVTIAGTGFNSAVPTCVNGASGAITSYPASGSTTVSLVQGQSYSLSVTTDGDDIISVWIDSDHNLEYDTYEWTQVCTTSVANVANTVTITIPFSGYTGTTGMRIRSRISTVSNTSTDACTTFGSGEAEDYTVTITSGIPCTVPPAGGTAVSSVASACSGVSFTLSLSGNSVGSGTSYQWQSSSNNINWAPLVGATGSACVTSLTAPLYYRCIVTCSGSSVFSASVFVGIASVSQCYCTSIATSNADDDIGNVTFGSLNNGVAGAALNNVTSVNLYTDFTGLNPQSYFPGSSYPLSVTQINRVGFYLCYLKVFIDYNLDGDFADLNEEIFSSTSNSAIGGNIMSGTVTIPMTAVVGVTRMRFVLSENQAASCGSYTYGETEDYLIAIQQALPCVAPPIIGTIVSSQNSLCPSQVLSLQLSGNSIGLGQTYQWQSSTTGASWTNILGAANPTCSTTQSQATYYRCYTVCSGMTDTSASVLINMNPLTNCYCASAATNVVDDDIGNVIFGTLNNGIAGAAINNPASVNLYTNYTALPPQSYVQTFNYPIQITQINSAAFYACWANVFIDYNQDGDFTDLDERVFSAATANGLGANVVSGNITIPLTATPGNTRLRIVLTENSSALEPPCGSYTWGETEDYTITIIPIAPCTAPPIAGVAIASSGSVCPHAEFMLSLSGNSIGLGLTYQWEVSANGSNWSSISGATSSTCLTSQLSANYYRCELTCTGIASVSSSILVPMESGSASFSNTIGGLIPDNNIATCFPIVVSGIANQIDTLFGLTEVCIDIQHPFVGELKIFLKSPAGDTIYLSENNGGLFANYSNTCFAMNGSNGYVYAGSAPFFGTYIPNYSLNDLNNGQNPNGTWYLCVKDEAPSGSTPAGQLISASVSFCSNPPKDPVIPVGGCSGTNAFGCQCPDGSQECDLLPDMTASALIIQNDHPESLGYMRLSNATPNVGWGPMEIHGSGQCFCDTVSVSCSLVTCPNGQPVKELVKQTVYHKNHGVMTTYTHDAGFMSYHPTHGHVHVDAWGAFSLRVPTSNPDATTWPIVGTGAKVSFCLINLGNCTNNLGYCLDNAGNVITQADIPNSGFGSVTGCGTDQGIFTGSLDIYSSGLQGMQMDFPGACNGNYAIVSITDPNNNFKEHDETNNWVQVPVVLTQQFPPTGVSSFAYSAAGNTVSFTNTTPLSSGYLWDFGDGTTDTTTNPIHTYAGNGPYSVKLISLNHCYTAATQLILITAITENENFALGFSANPNPSNGDVNISYFLPIRNKVSIDLYNLLGEKMTSVSSQLEEVGKHQLDFNFRENGFESGTYLLKISIAGKSQVIRLVLMN